MKNKDKIIILKARIIELERKLKKAQKTCAKQDNDIDKISEQLSLEKQCNEELRIFLQTKDDYIEKLILVTNAKPNPIESTKELFESTMQKVMDENTKDNSGAFIRETTNQKGYVYYNLSNNHKCYAVGITDKNQEVLWDDRKEQAKIYNSFEEFQNEYKDVKSKSITPIFEPITPPLTPPTKENINYDFGG